VLPLNSGLRSEKLVIVLLSKYKKSRKEEKKELIVSIKLEKQQIVQITINPKL
jgi:hypothetical protein